MAGEEFHQLDDGFLRSIQNHHTLFIFYTSPLKCLDTFYSFMPLIELYIISCHFNDKVVECLCNALKSSRLLSLFCLYDNKLLYNDVLKIVNSLNVSSNVANFLFYEKSLSDQDVDGLNKFLAHNQHITKLVLVSTSKIVAVQASSYQVTLACTYVNSVSCLYLRECDITHEVMIEVATLLNSSPVPCNVLDLSGSRVDDSHLDVLINALDPEIIVKSLSLPANKSSLVITELICCVHPSSVNISGSLTDGNNQSVGMVVAENLFTSQRQSIVMLTCDNEKVGIFHKLDYYSSSVVENTSQLTQLFINNCTIDGEVLANSLDNSESVVLLHLSNMKWNEEVFYTTNSFIKNERVTVSVCENSLPEVVIQNLLNTFKPDMKISRIISTNDIFIAHSCSYELVRWHLTQEVSCDPLELFYMSNCPMSTDPDWCKVFANNVNHRKLISEVILHGNNISTKAMYSLLLNTAKELICKLFIFENVLNCSLIISLLSAVPHVTLLSSNMFISVRGVSEHIIRAVSIMHERLKVLRMIHCDYTIESFNALVGAIKMCTDLQELAVSGGNFTRFQMSAYTTMLSALLGITSLTHFSFSHNKITDDHEAVDVLKTIITNNSKLEELRLNSLSLNSINTANICLSVGIISSLKILSLTDNMISEAAAPDLADAIANNTGLEKLYLDNNYLGTEGIAKTADALMKITKLKVLRFKNNRFQGRKVANKLCKVISNNSCLENICFDCNQLKTTGIKEALQGFGDKSQLTVLGVNNSGVTKEAATYIADVITRSTKLEKLQLCDNFLMAEGCNIIVSALKYLNTLTKLYISNNNIAEQAADGIAEVINNNISLQVLDVGSNLLLTTGITKIASALNKVHKVKELWINNNYVTEEAADEIAAVIASNPKLEKLQLDNNSLKTAGVHIICKALQQSSCLKVLLIGNNGVSRDSADDIAAVITNNPLIEVLELGNNTLETTGAARIASALCGVSHLKALSLENNFITSDAAEHIAAAIASNTGLEKLWLQNNRLENKGIKAICKALECAKNLKLFELNNKVTKLSFDAIAAVIVKDFSCFETLRITECVISTSVMVKIKKAHFPLYKLKRLRLNDNTFYDGAVDIIAAVIANNTELERLSLHNNALGDSGISKIMTAINRISTLRVLHLGNNNITESSAGDIAVVVANNPFLECVYLGNNRLKAAGVKKLAYGFKNLHFIKELGLNNNHLDIDAAVDVACMVTDKTQLEKLWINNNRLRASGVNEVCSSLKKTTVLKYLQFENNKITQDAVDAIANVLKNNPMLEDLFLGSNLLQTQGIVKLTEVLKEMHCLKRLSLSENCIMEEAANGIAEVITENISLESIWLNNNYFNDVGLGTISKALMKLHSLKVLQLDNSNIATESVDDITVVISKNPLLEIVSFGNNNMGSKSVIKLLQALKQLHHLKVLELNDNAIEEDAAKHIAEVINNNTGLEKLHLNNNKLKGVGLKQLCDQIKQHSSFKHLLLDSNNITDEAADGLVSVLNNNVLIEVFSVETNKFTTIGTVKVANATKQLHNLTKLAISSDSFTEKAVDAIAGIIVNNKGLKVLWLCGNDLKDEGIITVTCALKELKDLKGLHFTYSNITVRAADNIAEAIANNPLLEHVDLGCNRLGSRGVVKLAGGLKMLRHLKTLGLNDNGIEEDAAKHIAEVINNNTGLETLDLDNNKLNGVGVKNLSKSIQRHSNFKHLLLGNNDITDEAVDDLTSVIINNRSLEVLNIERINCTSVGIISLTNAMKHLHNLTKLDSNFNLISKEAADGIAEVISNNREMETLWLCGNDLKDEGISKVASALKKIHCVKHLRLAFNNITEEAAGDIAEAIANNPLLEHVDLGGNRLGSRGVVKLAGGLKMLHHLKILGLYNNGIGEDAAKHIAEVINYNSGLEKLYLFSNNLEGVGVKVLCEGIKTHSKFKVLLLDNNNINEEATDALASVISMNKSLEVFGFASNNIITTSFNKLSKGMKQLCNLKILNICNNKITEEVADGISQFIINNNGLESLWLSNNSLRDKGTNAVACGLTRVKFIKDLHLANNNISGEAAEKLAEAITNNPLLEHVDLGGNRLGSRGVVKLAGGLKMLHHLKTLELDDNGIEEDAAKHISEVINSSTRMMSLSLNDNKLKGVGAKELFNTIPQHSSFELLQLKNNLISEEAASAIALVVNNNTSLAMLCLGGNELKTTGVNIIMIATKGLCNLKAVDISDNQITDEAADSIAAMIKENANLKALALHDNYLTSTAAKIIGDAIKRHITLKLLSLQSRYIHQTEKDRIKQIIEDDTQLVCFGVIFMRHSKDFKQFRDDLLGPLKRFMGNVMGNHAESSGRITRITETSQLSDANVDVIKNASTLLLVKMPSKMMREYPDFVVIYWSTANELGNLFQDGELCKNVSTLVVRRTPDTQISNLDVAMITRLIKKNDNMQILDIGKFSAIPLSRSKFNHCDISNNIITMSMQYQKSFNPLDLTPLQLLHPVSSLRAVKMLNLSGNKVTQEAAEMLATALSQVINLESLLMEDCDLQTEALEVITNSLPTTKKLSILDLSLNNISPSVAFNYYITTFSKVDGSLNNLYLDGNIVKFLKEVKLNGIFTALTDLSIDITILPELMYLYEIALISGIKLNLKRLMVCDYSCKEKAIVVLSNPSRQSKKLIVSQGIEHAKSDEAEMVMPHRLHSLKLMVFIEVNEEAISLSWDKSISLKNIGVMLYLRTIEYFEEFVCCNLTDDHMTEADVRIISTIIKGNANLRTISLSRYPSSPKRFYESPTMQMLALKIMQQFMPCNASMTAIKEISFGLQHSSLLCLKILNLSGNYISEETAEILAIALGKCTVLETLLLKNCELNSESLKCIGNSMAMIGSLKSCDLSCNKLNEQSFVAVATIIKTNQELRELYIDNNSYSLDDLPDSFWLALASAYLSFVAIDGVISESTLCQLKSFTVGGGGIERLLLVHPSFLGTVTINVPKCLETISVKIIKVHSHCFIIEGKESETTTVDWQCTKELISSGSLKLLGAFRKVTNVLLQMDYDYTEQEVDEIANVLSNYSELREFTFLQIAPYAMVKCLQSVNVTKSLNEIKICQCNVNVDTAACLSSVLSNNKAINNLVLRNCCLKASELATIMSSLQTRGVVKLDLTSNYITDEAVNNISGVILCSTNTLETFNIGSNKLQAKGMINLLTSLMSVSSLIHLSLACNKITENISENISSVICNNPKLQSLCLHDVCLQTKSVAKALKSLSDLQFLDLSNNCIEEEAASDLAAIVNSNINLKQVYVGENYFGPIGVTALANALAALRGLQRLDISNNGVTVESADSIGNIIKNNIFLKSLLIGSGCRQISTKQLERSYVDEFILQQKWCTKIASSCGTDNSTFNTVKSNKFIVRVLDCANIKSPMTKCNKLQTKGIIKVCKALKSCKSLLRFSIENNDIGDKAADDIAAVLSNNSELEQLWIGSNYFSSAGISKIMKPLETITTLKVLDLSHIKISVETAYDVAKALVESTAIEQLWLENNSIPPDGLFAILFALLKCLNLTVISLRGNVSNEQRAAFTAVCTLIYTHVAIQHIYLGKYAIHDAGVSMIELALRNVSHLHTLDLSNTNITEVSVDSIVKVITSSSQLQQLFLGDNKLCSSGAIKIVTALQCSHAIQVLGLSHNHITREAAGEISTAVSSMPYLSTLMLDGNELKVDGVCTIIEGVQELNWLMILSVTDNVNSEEEEFLRESFADNTKFKLYM